MIVIRTARRLTGVDLPNVYYYYVHDFFHSRVKYRSLKMIASHPAFSSFKIAIIIVYLGNWYIKLVGY